MGTSLRASNILVKGDLEHSYTKLMNGMAYADEWIPTLDSRGRYLEAAQSINIAVEGLKYLLNHSGECDGVIIPLTREDLYKSAEILAQYEHILNEYCRRKNLDTWEMTREIIITDNSGKSELGTITIGKSLQASY